MGNIIKAQSNSQFRQYDNLTNNQHMNNKHFCQHIHKHSSHHFSIYTPHAHSIKNMKTHIAFKKQRLRHKSDSDSDSNSDNDSANYKDNNIEYKDDNDHNDHNAHKGYYCRCKCDCKNSSSYDYMCLTPSYGKKLLRHPDGKTEFVKVTHCNHFASCPLSRTTCAKL